MQNRKKRLEAITTIIKTTEINNQEELLSLLETKGFSATQATLSRDMKQLKISKSPNADGVYIYQLPKLNNYTKNIHAESNMEGMRNGLISIAFSGNLAVAKTRSGYAMGIASDIDRHSTPEILGTIAGDDTILIILQENVAQQTIISILNNMTIDNR